MRLISIPLFPAGPDLAASFPGAALWTQRHAVTTTTSMGGDMKKLSIIALLVCGVSAAAVAGASVPPPTALPEPGTLGLLAAGVAGIVAAARLRRRK